jgi:hypothetical protein
MAELRWAAGSAGSLATGARGRGREATEGLLPTGPTRLDEDQEPGVLAVRAARARTPHPNAREALQEVWRPNDLADGLADRLSSRVACVFRPARLDASGMQAGSAPASWSQVPQRVRDPASKPARNGIRRTTSSVTASSFMSSAARSRSGRSLVRYSRRASLG